MVFRSTPTGIAGRIVRAAGAQGINQFARIVQMFVLVPICLTAWGTGIYEDWVLVNSITAFLVLADFGLVQSTTVKLLDAWSKHEADRFSYEWQVALGLFAGLSGTLICLLALAWAEPGWASLIPGRHLRGPELAATCVLLSVMQIASILITVGLAAYRARGALSRSYHLSSILVIAQTAGVAGAAFFGAGPLGAAAATCIVTVGTLAGAVADLSLRYRDMRWTPLWPSNVQSRLRQASGYLVAPVSTTIMMNGPSVILANCGAPEGAIALFTATRAIAGVARQLPYQFAHPAGVELAALMARGDRAGLARLYASASRALAVVVGVLSGVSVVVAPLVMTLWTHGKIPYDQSLMLFLIGATLVCAPSQVAYTFLWYGGYPRLLNKALVISTGIAIGSATLFATRFGARGLAAGLGLGEIAGIAVYLSLLVDRSLGRKSGSSIFGNLCIAAASFACSAGSAYAIDRLTNPRGWLGLVEMGVLWTIPAAAGLFWIFMSGPQRTRVMAPPG